MIEQLAAMPKYEAYKNSGAEWLGDIPEKWEVKSIKSLLAERKEKNDPIKTSNILSLTMDRGVIPYAEKGAGGNKAKEDLTAYRLAYPGDIVLNSMNVVVGSVGLSKYFGAVSPVYYMLYPRKKEDQIEYFDAIFQNEAFQKSLVGLGNGILVKKSESSGKLNTIRMRIPMSKLNMVLIPYPSPAEQTAIAAFLDCKTAQIDQAVAIKEKQIALLKERKQILIQNAVTRGLNPDAPMRDSGVEWIGEIPAHWEVKKLKYVAGDFMYGTSVDCNELGAGTPVLRIPNIGELDISFEDLKYAALTETETNRYLLKKNDILIVRTNGNPNLVGKSAIFAGEEDYMFASYLIRVKPKINIEPRFLIHAMNSFSIRGSLTHSSRTSAGNYNLNTQALGDCYLAYPSKEEQTGIVAHIEIESAKIDQAISIQQQQIDKLKEYKATLINSAVTGKIKVA